MRKIGIRQFQQNFHKEIKQLPFVVTKRDEILFHVVKDVQDFYRGGYHDVEKYYQDDVTTDVTTHQSDTKAKFIKTTMNDESFLPTEPVEESSKYPNNLYGKPLSGRKKECHVCYEETPIEFVNQHYMDKHGDI